MGAGHFQAAVGLNSGNEWDEQIEKDYLDVWIAAYTVAPP
jgi:hypothetical protein